MVYPLRLYFNCAILLCSSCTNGAVGLGLKSNLICHRDIFLVRRAVPPKLSAGVKPKASLQQKTRRCKTFRERKREGASYIISIGFSPSKIFGISDHTKSQQTLPVPCSVNTTFLSCHLQEATISFVVTLQRAIK